MKVEVLTPEIVLHIQENLDSAPDYLFYAAKDVVSKYGVKRLPLTSARKYVGSCIQFSMVCRIVKNA